MNYSLDVKWFLKLGLDFNTMVDEIEDFLNINFNILESKEFNYFKQFKVKDFVLNVYTSGKILIQGACSLENRILLVKHLQKSVSHKINYDYYIGVDEAGKGEKQGEIVSGALFCKKEDIPFLMALGVTDSKSLNKAKLAEIGMELERNFIFNKVALTPQDVNVRWRELGNLNVLLEEIHFKNIQQLISKIELRFSGFTKNLQIVIDKFSSSETRTRSTMRRYLKNISDSQVVLENKAEYYPFVAGASIIAKLEYEKTKADFQVMKNWKSTK